MKILSLQQNLPSRQLSTNERKYAFLKNNQNDSFERTSQPNFKATQNIKPAIIPAALAALAALNVNSIRSLFSNPEMSEEEANTIASSLQSQSNNAEQENPIFKIFENMNSMWNRMQEQLDALKKQNEVLQEKVDTLTQSIEATSKQATNSNETPNAPTLEETPATEGASKTETTVDKSDEQPADENLKKDFQFPQKSTKGPLTKEYRKLKTTTASINIPQTHLEKLTEICKKLLKNNTHIVDEKEKTDKEIALELANELEKAQNESEIAKIIDKYYSICINNTGNSDKTSDVGRAEENSSSTTDTSTSTTSGVKIVGHVDLSRIPQRGNAAKPDITEEDRENRTYIYCIPGDPKSTNENIAKLLRNFKTTMKKWRTEEEKNNPNQTTNKYLKWKRSYPVLLSKDENMRIEYLTNSITEEIAKYQRSASPYRNINDDNINEVANALISEKRFCDLFSFHAALRLIDRFVKFDSEIPIEAQCKNIIDRIENVIRKSIQKGVEVQCYEDEKNYLSAELHIDSSIYDTEDKKVFGSFPLFISLSETVTQFANNKNEYGIICTIYPKGI